MECLCNKVQLPSSKTLKDHSQNQRIVGFYFILFYFAINLESGRFFQPIWFLYCLKRHVNRGSIAWWWHTVTKHSCWNLSFQFYRIAASCWWKQLFIPTTAHSVFWLYLSHLHFNTGDIWVEKVFKRAKPPTEWERFQLSLTVQPNVGVTHHINSKLI